MKNKMIGNLKLYLGAVATIAFLGATPLTVQAEELLFEVTEENNNEVNENGEVKYESTPTETVEANSDNSVQVVEVTSDKAPSLTSDPGVDKSDDFDQNNTTIDEEDKKYDTGRTEIPDYVETEKERKHIDDTPGNPTPTPDTPTPGNPTPTPGNPTPGNPTPSNPTPTVNTPTPKIDKTGDESKNLLYGILGLIFGGATTYKVIDIKESKKKANKVAKKLK